MVLFFWTTLASVSFKKCASCQGGENCSLCFLRRKRGTLFLRPTFRLPLSYSQRKCRGGGEVLSLFDDGGVFSLGSKKCPRLGEVTDLLLFFGRLGRGDVSPLPLRISYTVVEEEERFSLFDDDFSPLPFLYGARLRIVLPYFLRKSGGGGGIVLSF